MNPVPTKLTAGAAALVAAVHKITVDPTMPTIATSVDKGQVRLALGKAYLDVDDETKSVMLEHEACHVAMRCTERYVAHQHHGQMPAPEHWKANPIDWHNEQQRRQMWNVAHDAVIHHRCLDPSRVDEKAGFESVTFERLKMSPRSCESTYDELLKKAEENATPAGCGRGMGDGEPLPDWLSAEVADAVAREYASYGSGGSTRVFGPSQPPPPKWARLLEAWLRKSCKRGRERKRSWLQINRRNPWLPGMVHLRGESALVLVDVSGSIPVAQVEMVCGLVNRYHRSVEVSWWADRASPRRSARLALAMKDNVGGGTNPHPAAALRRQGEPVIWITDSEVPSWPTMTQLDLVLTTGADAPQPALTVRI
jgi:hypothetical protein